MLLQRPAKRGALFNLNEMFEMKENLILVNYKVESEAYQALLYNGQVTQLLHKRDKGLHITPGNGVVVRGPIAFQQIHEVNILPARCFQLPGAVDLSHVAVHQDLHEQTR